MGLVFTFPYHDPDGILNEKFKEALPKLIQIFSKICLSVTPGTIESNSEFIDYLKEKDCVLLFNEKDSNIGDHYRNALKIAADEASSDIFFGFIDRVIYAINSEFSERFESDVGRDFQDMVLFERSELAWSKHPDNYREIEQYTNKIAKYLTGNEIELATCGFLIKADIAREVLKSSIETSYSAATEWIFSAYLLGVKPEIKKVDWLSWEDPYIFGKDGVALKKEREKSPQENLKRYEMNLPIINVLAQKRFYTLFEK